MPTVGINFTFTVQACHFWVKEDIKFFFNTKLAYSTYRGVGLCAVYNFPFDCVFNFSAFQVPNVGAQGGLVGFRILERVFMYTQPGFKRGRGQANVGVGWSLSLFNCDLVH